MKLKANILGLAGLLLLYVLITNIKVGSVLPLDVATAQAVIFPLVILWLLVFRLAGVKVPLAILLVSFCAAFVSAGYTYFFSLNDRAGIVLARLSGDELQNATRIFRESVRSKLDHLPLSIQSSSATVDSFARAATFLNKRPELQAVVWGSRRWLNISFKPESDLPISVLTGKLSERGEAGLSLIQSVPVIGVSFNPAEDTSGFLSSLFEGLSLRMRLQNDSMNGWEEIALVDAGNMRAGWTAAAHLAYPWWRLGNRYLLEAFYSGKFEKGPLKCALRAYKIAKRMLRRNENPELRAAIFNNYAIALYVQSVQSVTPRKGKRTLSAFKRAASVTQEKNVFHTALRSPYIATLNLQLLKGERVKGKTKRDRSPEARAERKAKKAARKLNKKSSGNVGKNKGKRKRTNNAK